MSSHCRSRTFGFYRFKSELAFTLVELMIVILVIAILVAIAVPVYLSISDKASRTTAESNQRIGEDAMTRIYMDIIVKGGDTYYDPDESAPVDASYMSARETKINWWDFPMGSGWPAFDDVSEHVHEVAIVSGTDLGPGNADYHEIVIASLAQDGTCYFTHFTYGRPDDSGTFDWDDGPPGGP